MKKLLHLDFLPCNTDLGLLILRVVFGGGMVFLHGWKKLEGFSEMTKQFPSYIINSQITLGCTIFTEVVCAILLLIGLFGRFAAAGLAVTMAVAFFVVHKGALMGEQSGEMALLYLAAYGALVFTGMGKYSVDRR